jgi:hypothetical protein
MADNDPYTYDDESGIMELRLVGDEFVPQQAIGTLPEAYYVDPAIDDATIEKYGMSEPYLPANFQGQGVTALGRLVRDASMRDQGKFPLATLGGDPRVFASGNKISTRALGEFVMGDVVRSLSDKQKENRKYTNLKERFDYSDRPYLFEEMENVSREGVRTGSPTEFGIIYVPGTNPKTGELYPDDFLEKSQLKTNKKGMETPALHEALHRAFEIILNLRPNFEQEFPMIYIRGGKGRSRNLPLDEEAYARLFDLGTVNDENAEDYFRVVYNRDVREILNHPAVQANLLRYQKVSQDLARDYSGEFGYEFAPSQVNLPDESALKKITDQYSKPITYVDQKDQKIKRRDTIVIK